MRSTPTSALRFALFLFLAPSLLQAQDRQGYYRFPTLHGETVIFAAEGDLWKAPVAGGPAQRLTTHPGEEAAPATSPDGTLLAFTATYEGPAEVYTMPVDGGLPKRLTYEGNSGRSAPAVVGWTPDGHVLVRTWALATLPNAQLIHFDPHTGERTLVPLAQASEGVYDPSGHTLYFTRLSKQSSNNRNYHGGTTQNLWVFNEDLPEALPLTADYAGTSHAPMWWDHRLYFASDRDGTMNLWSMTPEGGDLRQLTFHDGWDVQTPALSEGRIVYQLGADLRLFDLRSNQDRPIPLTLQSDFDQRREQWIDDPMDYLAAAHLSPDGSQVVLTARGEVFVAPVKQGRFVRATRNPGVRYRTARFNPKDNTLLALSDESGEVEWWTLPAEGIGTASQVTRDGAVLRFDGLPSPDGTHLAHVDQDDQLWITTLASGATRKIATSSQGGFSLPAWSPDSRRLAYAMAGDNAISQIYLFDVAAGTSTPVTTDRYDSYNPAWSPDGHWLYFLSDRFFASLVGSPWGSRQPDPFFDRQTQVFALALTPDTRFPFQPSDELYEPKAKEEQVAASPVQVAVTLEGLQDRLYLVPVPNGNYSNLTVNDKRLFWISAETSREGTRHLQALDIGPDVPKPVTVVEDIRGYEGSQDGKKLLVRKGPGFYVLDAAAPAGAKLDDARLNLSNWTFSINPREEWRQLFVDAWRLYRDYFYDRNMHGLDWPAILQKYLPLVDRVTSRTELNDLQAQMVSETSTLHTFVRGGDVRVGEDQVLPGSLGAVLTRDDAAGGYRITHIYRADPDLPDERAPLDQPRVAVQEGDLLTALNGVDVLSVPDPSVLLRNEAGKQVRMAFKKADGTQREAIVTPITPGQEADLRYNEWEYTRRLLVDEWGDDHIGYVHLSAMGGGNMAEWQRGYYPVFNRQGLILDVRHNRGGNIDSWILGKLLRRAWFYWQGRTGAPTWNMQYAFRGHMVVLVDAFTASDGEAFAEGFRRLGLGQVIGTRTWGGEIWLSANNFQMDGGIATAAETGVYGPEGMWLIEGHGVDPDIVVDNLPHATFNGDDAQLRAAVEHLQALIRQDPRDVPPPPSYPILEKKE